MLWIVAGLGLVLAAIVMAVIEESAEGLALRKKKLYLPLVPIGILFGIIETADNTWLVEDFLLSWGVPYAIAEPIGDSLSASVCCIALAIIWWWVAFAIDNGAVGVITVRFAGIKRMFQMERP